MFEIIKSEKENTMDKLLEFTRKEILDTKKKLFGLGNDLREKGEDVNTLRLFHFYSGYVAALWFTYQQILSISKKEK